MDIPSYSVRIGDVITVRDKSATSTKFKDVLEAAESKTVVAWLERDLEARSGKVVRFPERQEIDVPVTEQLIIEFYSR